MDKIEVEIEGRGGSGQSLNFLTIAQHLVD